MSAWVSHRKQQCTVPFASLKCIKCYWHFYFLVHSYLRHFLMLYWSPFLILLCNGGHNFTYMSQKTLQLYVPRKWIISSWYNYSSLNISISAVIQIRTPRQPYFSSSLILLFFIWSATAIFPTYHSFFTISIIQMNFLTPLTWIILSYTSLICR